MFVYDMSTLFLCNVNQMEADKRGTGKAFDGSKKNKQRISITLRLTVTSISEMIRFIKNAIGLCGLGRKLIYCKWGELCLNALKSLYVPPGLTCNNSTFCPRSVFVCFVWIWEQTAIISLYSIN